MRLHFNVKVKKKDCICRAEHPPNLELHNASKNDSQVHKVRLSPDSESPKFCEMIGQVAINANKGSIQSATENIYENNHDLGAMHVMIP